MADNRARFSVTNFGGADAPSACGEFLKRRRELGFLPPRRVVSRGLKRAFVRKLPRSVCSQTKPAVPAFGPEPPSSARPGAALLVPPRQARHEICASRSWSAARPFVRHPFVWKRSPKLLL